jgi:rubrerythrin
MSETLSEASPKALRCTNCGHVLAGNVISPPPCPACGAAPYAWELVAEDKAGEGERKNQSHGAG